MKNKNRKMYKDGGSNKGNESAKRHQKGHGGGMKSMYKNGGGVHSEVMPKAKPC